MLADIVGADGNGISRNRSYAIPGSDVSDGIQQRARTRSRIGIYIGGATGLVILFVLLRGSDWQGSATLHTIMEAVATLLAMLVGILALVRYYSQKNSTILLIGVGFLGAAFLDGYHAVITSWIIKDLFPSGLSNLIPWSWVASRLYLSVVLFLSVIAWRQEAKPGVARLFKESTIYSWAVMLLLASFALFIFVPLPAAYYPDIPFHRPEEFAPAVFFRLTLVGYLRKNRWREDPFERWLVVSIVIGFVS